MTGSGASRPNILLIVVDDMGWSDISPFGGELHTPALESLAARGVRFGGFHTSSLCAPTRAMLLSGCDNHQAGMGVMQPVHAMNQYRKPGYEGCLNRRVWALPELLAPAGYHTWMAGKWHVGITDDTRPAARGFQRSFAFLGGGVSHFDDARALSVFEAKQSSYVDDDVDVTDRLPGDFYSTTHYVDTIIGYLREQQDDAPFFAYLALTAPHDPLQVPDSWLDRCAGRYDGGYDVIREARLARLKEIGLAEEWLETNPGTGLFPRWADLTEPERAREARVMEIYASMLELVDAEVDRLMGVLEALGRLDDTVVIFMSDNGANPRQPWGYPPNDEQQIAREYDNSLENIGRKGSFVAMGGAWAEVANTPFSYFKMTTYEGGIQTPLIIAGGPVTARGQAHEALHVTDIFPTVLELAGVDRPSERDGARVPELYGRSLVPWLTGGASGPVRGPDEAMCFEMFECRSVLKGRWKLVWTAPPYGQGDGWRLFDLVADPREREDLAASHPEQVADLTAEWEAYAASVGYIEADGTSAVAELGIDRFFDA